jgi:hypothetical protein
LKRSRHVRNIYKEKAKRREQERSRKGLVQTRKDESRKYEKAEILSENGDGEALKSRDSTESDNGKFAERDGLDKREKGRKGKSFWRGFYHEGVAGECVR